MDPCKQEAILAEHKVIISAISETLKEFKHGQQRFIEVLEKIAEQGQHIVNLEANGNRLQKDVNGLFSRVRDLEVEPGRQGKTIWIGAIMSVVTVVISIMVGRLFK